MADRRLPPLRRRPRRPLLALAARQWAATARLLPGTRPGRPSRTAAHQAAVAASLPDLAADLLACHRLTRLVTADVLTAPLRERLVRYAYRRHEALAWDDPAPPLPSWQDYAEADPEAPWLATLVTCRWCTSVWVGAGVVAARRWLPGWGYVARALAASSVAGLLRAAEGEG